MSSDQAMSEAEYLAATFHYHACRMCGRQWGHPDCGRPSWVEKCLECWRAER